MGGNTFESKGEKRRTSGIISCLIFHGPFCLLKSYFSSEERFLSKILGSKRLGNKLEELPMVKGWDNSSIKKGKNCNGSKDK